MSLISTTRRALAVLGVLALGAAAAATAVAATGDPAGITGCVASTGTLRVVGSGTACKKGETPLSWNQQGVQGAAGPAGAQGPVGPAGDVQVTYISTTLTVPAGPDAFGSFPAVSCPEGTEVVNGTAHGIAWRQDIVADGYIDTDADGWVFLYGNDGPSFTLAAKVACV